MKPNGYAGRQTHVYDAPTKTASRRCRSVLPILSAVNHTYARSRAQLTNGSHLKLSVCANESPA